jgi:hypothetical protein
MEKKKLLPSKEKRVHMRVHYRIGAPEKEIEGPI